MCPFADGPIKFVKNVDQQFNVVNVNRFGRDFSIIRVPYAFKLLMQELQCMNVQMRIITEDNVNFTSEFGLGRAGDTANQSLDASWLLLFETNGETYTLTTRSMRYVFESD